MMAARKICGNLAYNVGCVPVEAYGLLIPSNEAMSALSKRVAERLRDTDGKSAVAAPIAGLQLTKFQQANLERILKETNVPEWRIGEALAECYLEDNYDCLFPWQSGRDMRNPNASLSGADLVGFQGKSGQARFAFGEVKTSEDKRTPPKVMSGRNGMVCQLETLCDDLTRINTLVRYLGIRHIGQPWSEMYKTAFIAYLNNTSDIVLLGVLVRTTTADAADLQKRVKNLAAKNPKRAVLLALYIPLPLRDWKNIVFSKEGGGAS
ncbi:MAG: hypothetical protein QHH10_11100 [Peptococcaceae bacterium]|jgi:hypothetical protein|nr:hypothetical protein [Peptococcaceae bacterium]MDH7525846.1 hypothetical protein [Peptococcaceae bacterium]